MDANRVRQPDAQYFSAPPGSEATPTREHNHRVEHANAMATADFILW
ncbi:MAG: hypothetical protein ACFB4J_18080 [Elainellaceae cyanobacterium]